MVRKHIANEHNETMPPSMYGYFQGAVWQRKKLPQTITGGFEKATETSRADSRVRPTQD